MRRARIRVKYCGGCNPRYDRGELVARLVADVPEADFSLSAGDHDLALVVCGCHSRCASREGLGGRLNVVLTGSCGDCQELRLAIRQVLASRKE